MSPVDQLERGAARAPRPEPHPRMRARRVEVARDLGRRRRRRINVVLAVVCLGVWSLVVLRSSLLDVDRVEVSGARTTSREAVVEAAGAGPGTEMVGLDTAAVAERVEALPWVDDARVSRVWPGTLRVQVTERRAVAQVRTPDGWLVLDGEGRVLERRGARAEDLLVVVGSVTTEPGDRVPAALRSVLAVVADLPSALRSEVAGATRGADGIALEMESGPCLLLGDGSEVEAKATAAEAVRHRLEDADDARLDVRVPSAPALTRGAGCA